MPKELPPLIASMSRPEFYADAPSEVEFRQTHISYVFLVGPYVYKIKKSLHLPFLDYSTLERRKHFCHEEIRLNRRLAPDVYLEVVPIVQQGGSFFLAENGTVSGETTEYAVKMKRLPRERILDFCLQRNSVTPHHIGAIARKIASFHETASTEKGDEFGSLEAVATRVLANFRETREFITHSISKKRLERIRAYSEAFLNDNRDLFRSRITAGRIREGHGDLRAEHICLLDEIVVFDCIEFDEALRYGDVASEIAFLSMDFEFLAVPAFSTQLEEEYASLAGDPGLFSLLPFYKSYRAYVRGKVESFKSAETEVAGEERRKAAQQAKRYFCLSSRYARRKTRPCLLVVCGMVGTGKSTVARLLADLSGFAVFNSDLIRKKLAGLSITDRNREGYGHGIYTERVNELTYQTLWQAAETHLARGAGAIVDATFKDSKHRSLFAARAAAAGVPAYFVECRLDEKTARQRLNDRAKAARDVSDATWATYERMREEFQPLAEIPPSRRFEIDTGSGLLEGLDRVEEVL